MIWPKTIFLPKKDKQHLYKFSGAKELSPTEFASNGNFFSHFTIGAALTLMLSSCF